MVRLGGFAKRRIHEMSGGQQQRVALARAIVNKSVGPPARRAASRARQEAALAMQIELQTLQRELGITFVLVTHDQEEALLDVQTIVCVMNAGRIRPAQAHRRRSTTARPTCSWPISSARPIG